MTKSKMFLQSIARLFLEPVPSSTKGQKMPRKIIGITGPSSFTTEVISMVEQYFDCNPLMLYMDQDQNLTYWMNKVHAVILGGGVDIHPMIYNISFPAGKNMKNFDLRRDRRELKIIDHAIRRKIPILGICRGHQLLGLYRKKMKLITDLCAESVIVHCPVMQESKFVADAYTPIHKVGIIKGKTLFGKVSNGKFNDLWVNSFHHQGLLYEADPHEKDINIIGTSFVCKDKYIVEIMECPEEKWLSCQYHPEFDYREQESSLKLLEYFKKEYMGLD